MVRFGPWARNIYLGLPVAFTFALISVVAEMPWSFGLLETASSPSWSGFVHSRARFESTRTAVSWWCAASWQSSPSGGAALSALGLPGGPAVRRLVG